MVEVNEKNPWKPSRCGRTSLGNQASLIVGIAPHPNFSTGQPFVSGQWRQQSTTLIAHATDVTSQKWSNRRGCCCSFGKKPQEGRRTTVFIVICGPRFSYEGWEIRSNEADGLRDCTRWRDGSDILTTWQQVQNFRAQQMTDCSYANSPALLGTSHFDGRKCFRGHRFCLARMDHHGIHGTQEGNLLMLLIP